MSSSPPVSLQDPPSSPLSRVLGDPPEPEQATSSHPHPASSAIPPAVPLTLPFRDQVARAARQQFQEHSRAARDRKYGAVGKVDYLCDCDELLGFDVPSGEPGERTAVLTTAPVPVVKRSVLFRLTDALHVLEEEKGGGLLEGGLLDVGTGDGKILKTLACERGYGWAEVVGVSAEDMRGGRTTSDSPIFDVRNHGCPESSYLVMDLMDLVLVGPRRPRPPQEDVASTAQASLEEAPASSSSGATPTGGGESELAGPRPPEKETTASAKTTAGREKDDLQQHALRDRKFAFIFSWVTFCWLVDPLGVLCALFNDHLRPGGAMLVGHLIVLTQYPPEVEQRWLFAWGRWASDHASSVESVAMWADGRYSWILLRKADQKHDSTPLVSYPLTIEPALTYETGVEIGREIGYRVNEAVLGPYYGQAVLSSAKLFRPARRNALVDEFLRLYPQWRDDARVQEVLREHGEIKLSGPEEFQRIMSGMFSGSSVRNSRFSGGGAVGDWAPR